QGAGAGEGHAGACYSAADFRHDGAIERAAGGAAGIDERHGQDHRLI
nr:hypothetical protein [Tanacetum cinerariifolium]